MDDSPECDQDAASDSERRSDERDGDRKPGGAEGGEHREKAPLPFAPQEGDDSPLGDTDQHSDA